MPVGLISLCHDVEAFMLLGGGCQRSAVERRYRYFIKLVEGTLDSRRGRKSMLHGVFLTGSIIWIHAVCLHYRAPFFKGIETTIVGFS
jgi:hypothetical protein